MVKVRVNFDGLSCGRRPYSDSSLRLHIKLAMVTTQSQSEGGLWPDLNHPPLGQIQRANCTHWTGRTALRAALTECCAAQA